MIRYYTKDGKTYGEIMGRAENGKTAFYIYYDGWYAKTETHNIKLYSWAKGLHGNAPSGTPYGYVILNRTKQRLILTV